MTSQELHNPPGAGGNELTLMAGDNGLKAALAYGVWAVADAFLMADTYDSEFDPVSAVMFRTALIAAPAAAMIKLSGWKAYVPATFLALLGTMNGIGHLFGAAAGDPGAGYSYGIAHLFFAAAFARTGVSQFRGRHV